MSSTLLAMATTWKAIPGYEGRYEVSDDGRVKSLSDRFGRERILRAALTSRSSHRQVVLTDKNGQRKTKRVHALMMLAFVGPRPEGRGVRHLDGEGGNNALSNLRYGTRSENAFDDVAHGKNKNANKTHCFRGHEFTEENTQVKMGRSGKERNCKACLTQYKRDWQRRNRSRKASL